MILMAYYCFMKKNYLCRFFSDDNIISFAIEKTLAVVLYYFLGHLSYYIYVSDIFDFYCKEKLFFSYDGVLPTSELLVNNLKSLITNY
jgi:hypothetical protein